MKKNTYILLAVFTIHFSLFTINCYAQVLCIQCYNQNARVLTDTNNLVSNGGFENTTCNPYHDVSDTSFCPNSHFYHCDISNWICTGGGTSTYADICDSTFSTIIEGSKAVYFGNHYSYACATHDTSCISNMGCEIIGISPGYPISESDFGGNTGVSLEQTVNGLTTSAIYRLEFWAGGEKDTTLFLYEGIFAVDLGFGNIFLRDPITPPNIGIGTRYVIVFAATSSSHTIKFTNWGHCGINNTFICTELILDDVRLFAAAEGSNICATAINDLSQNDLVTVFPNPNNGDFTISLKQATKDVKVEIFNMIGEKIFSKIVAPAPLSFGEGLGVRPPAGVYIVKVTEGERQYFEKVMVE